MTKSNGLGLAGLVLLWALPLAAQISFDGVHATANGQLMGGYAGDFGNQQTNEHSMGFSGEGTVQGYYYNPNFLSFSVLPYYGRSQDNSDSQSITNASGYLGTLNIFGGSHFPGFVAFNQQFNSSGTFGIPGVAGLTTVNGSHGINVGWSALVPGLPTLSVGYGDTSGTSSLLGSGSSTASTNRTFTVASTYLLAGFYLNGGFRHMNTDASINGVLENGETEAVTDSSNQFNINATRRLPFYNSRLAIGASRSSYSGESEGVRNDGTTATANAVLGLGLPKLPVTLSANYVSNIFGSFEQQLVANGQAPLSNNILSPESRSLSVMANTFYTVLPRLTLNGFVNHTEEYFAGQDFGLTQFGINANYNFLRRIKGLTFVAGMVDTADQQGNMRVGFIGGANYGRAFGRWEVGSYFRYDQNTETLLVIYTTSTMSYGGSVKRNLGHGLHWMAIANGSRSAFEQQAGDGSHSESFNSMLRWRWVSLSANYTESYGTAILTANGLVSTPVPGQLISPSNFMVYNGKSYGGTFNIAPLRNLGISTSYSKSDSNTVSPLQLSNNGSTMYYGLLQYRLRKLVFSAGATNFRQEISTSGTLPSVVTSYSFGVTRWFKAF
jgi:hypothetical protein